MTKSLDRAKREHKKWLEKRGLAPLNLLYRRSLLGQKKFEYDLDVKKSQYPSHGIDGNTDVTAVKGIFSRFHKEKPGVQAEIMRKAARTAPLYNKGGYAYVTDGDGFTSIGSKSRRP